MKKITRFLIGVALISATVLTLDRQSPALRDALGDHLAGSEASIFDNANLNKTDIRAKLAEMTEIKNVKPTSLSMMIDEEYQLLYRSAKEAPGKAFQEGLLSKAHARRGEMDLAGDADYPIMLEHSRNSWIMSSTSPYISASQDILLAAEIARRYSNAPWRDWVYLIRTNRGVSVDQRFKKLGTPPGMPSFTKGESEREFLIPGEIAPEEIIGAWPLADGIAIYIYSHEHHYVTLQFGKKVVDVQKQLKEIDIPAGGIIDTGCPWFGTFQRNPRYVGPIPIDQIPCPVSSK